MYCKNCGAKINDGAAFCPNCGKKAEESAISHSAGVSSARGTKLLYVAHKSVFAHAKQFIGCLILSVITIILAIVFFACSEPLIGAISLIIFVICLGVVILRLIEARKYELCFYNGKIVEKSGIFNTKETQSIMTPIIAVNLEQNFWGKIFHYGNIIVDKTGKGWDVSTKYIKDPDKLKAFLETLISETDYGKLSLFISN